MNLQEIRKVSFLQNAFGLMLLVTMSLFLASCGSDDSDDLPDDNGPDAENPIDKDQLEVILLKKEVFKELYEPFLHYQFSYEYDEQNRVIVYKVELFDENGIIDPEKTWQQKMNYFEDKIITNTYINTGELTHSRHQIKIDDSLIRKEIYWKGTLGEIEMKNYDNNGCGLTEKVIYNDDVRAYSYTYEYTDENCSSVEKYYDFEGDLAGVKEQTRDNMYKFNPWSNTIISPNKSWTNNITDVKHYDRDGIFIDYASYTSEFIFNKKNYPVSEARTYGNGTIMNRTYEYYE